MLSDAYATVLDADVPTLVEDCVRRGVRELDEHGPSDWRQLVTRDVEIFSSSECVLGQVFGDFGSWSTLAFRTTYRVRGLTDVDCGFDAPTWARERANATWRRALTERWT